MHLSTFATEEFPLHPSGIPSLLGCNWRMASQHLMTDFHDEGGPAADTGSAMHRAAAEFHRGQGASASLLAMAAGIGKYPLADLADATLLFSHYAADARNGAKCHLVEEPIAFSIAPAPEDKTGQAISVIGTVDQVREHDDGRLRAWDIKTSKKEPMVVMNATVYQLAAYCVGASAKLGRRVDPGGIIMPRMYVKGQNPFWQYPWSYDDLEDIMQAVRHAVAAVRNGYVYHVPNENCRWCHFRSPDMCLPKLKAHRRESLVAKLEVLDPT